LLRGLMALSVVALLFIAAAVAPARSLETGALDSDCDRATAEAVEATEAVVLPRTVDFRSTLPGALHLVKRVKREG
jgi:hypothetical protein